MGYYIYIESHSLNVPNGTELETELFKIKDGEIEIKDYQFKWKESFLIRELSSLLKSGVQGVIEFSGEGRGDFFMIKLKDNKIFEHKGYIQYSEKGRKIGEIPKLEYKISGL